MARLLFLIAPAQQVDVRGRNVTAVVPEGARGGDTISVPVPQEFDVKEVMCSTLPSLPGMTVRLARSIIYGTASIRSVVSANITVKGHLNPKPGDDSMMELPQLITQAHAVLKQQAAAMGCNAVLGITLNISNDSSKTNGTLKVAIVTVTGTPCFLVADVKGKC